MNELLERNIGFPPEVGGRLKREGTLVYLRLINADVW